VEKRLPSFYKKEAMEDYFEQSGYKSTSDVVEGLAICPDSDSSKKAFDSLLARLIVSILYSLGLRRSEIIGLNIGSVDFGRKVVKVHGKGDKMREIPLVDSLSEEILLYLRAVETLTDERRSLKSPLLVTYTGKRLYPAYVDRTVKRELGDVKGITGRRSPHVLRHSLATELMNEEADLNSIKEMLGHSSLATTQVYTHSSFARLKNIYETAHPRAKNGGKHGD
jgi:integrase/recombinase XerC